ncbi:MAG TPA: type II secretion system minor pseudopilin GspH [Pseudomonadales bacterium]|nr:type II secretion system minor pseudopilin GspH [Pseudomonadales bacterium]
MNSAKQQSIERHPACRSRFYGNSGFTLIEVLIVVMVIGVMAGTVLFTMQPHSRSREVGEEAQRLYAMIRFATDESIYTSQELGIEVFGDGYRFLVLNEGQLDPNADQKDDGKTHEFSLDIKPMDQTTLKLNSKPPVANAKPLWTPVEKEKEFRAHKMPEGLRLLLEIEERKIEFKSKKGKMPSLGDGSQQSSIDDSEDDSDMINKKKPEDLRPSIYFLSSGETTPFKIEVFEEGKSDQAWTISCNELGELELKEPKGEE